MLLLTRSSVVLWAAVAAAMLVASGVALLVSVRSADAAFPGQNGRIALCHSNGSTIVSVRPDGSSYRTEVPSVSEYTCDPAYSPDGTKLAFTSDRDDGNYDIYVKDLATGRLAQLTHDDAGVSDRRPAWSPDGTKIVFDVFGNQFDLWVMDADGSNRRELTHSTAVSETQAAWSPDGTKIAFQREDNIWVMDADGSDQKNLTRTPNLEDRFPSWSPNGRRIAWAKESSPDTFDADIWKMRADGSGKVRLTFSAGHDGAPTWSPNGKKIAFIREGRIDTDVWKMNASDGSQKTNITNNDFDESDPDWQPKPAP